MDVQMEIQIAQFSVSFYLLYVTCCKLIQKIFGYLDTV